ncbi:hypothetical protein ACIGXA_06545 [Streptomyces fildesensis]|uniref:Uncharacterized protein n=1 Tax=Streptomyces fildesensis TaxID=375757 RepID=A0ABW8C158_9ACTN
MSSLFSETLRPESSPNQQSPGPSTDPFLSPALLPFTAAESDGDFDQEPEIAPR